MQITHLEMLSLEIAEQGYCIGRVCVHGSKGELIQIESKISLNTFNCQHHINAAIARDAIRQVKRMPEYRKRLIKLGRYAAPKASARRVIRLLGES